MVSHFHDGNFQMKQLQSQILSNTQISADFHELCFTWDPQAGNPLPGQFLTIRVSEDSVPLLRRPFAFSGFDENAGSASIIYQKRGRATQIMTGKQPGEKLDLIGPLGKPFPVPEQNSGLFLVAGGVGLGPVLFLANYLKAAGKQVTFVFGCRTESFVPSLPAFENAGPVICTDDGSAGFRGNSVEYLVQKEKIDSGSVLYGCGPDPMLRALAGLAVEKDTQVWVSVEQVMACGVGACMGCVVKTTSGYQRACKEGPVFSGRDIVWE